VSHDSRACGIEAKPNSEGRHQWSIVVRYFN
jgi:hypothetical protein